MSMTSFLSSDKYSLIARLGPILVVLLPIFLVIIGSTSGHSIGKSALAVVVVFVGFTTLLEQFMRDLGKKGEERLFKLWGGAPTTLMLQHERSSLDPERLGKYRDDLESITGLPLPSEKEETKNNESVSRHYREINEKMREMTRDISAFGIVHEELVQYSFRRNLWTLRPIGLLTSGIGIVVLSFFIHQSLMYTDNLLLFNIILLFVDLFLFGMWLLNVNSDWVRKAADRYAKQLIISCSKRIDS